MKLTIVATKTEAGEWKLVGASGADAQEGFGYPTKKQALEAAAKLWPANSVWHGHPVRDGWQIETV